MLRRILFSTCFPSFSADTAERRSSRPHSQRYRRPLPAKINDELSCDLQLRCWRNKFRWQRSLCYAEVWLVLKIKPAWYLGRFHRSAERQLSKPYPGTCARGPARRLVRRAETDRQGKRRPASISRYVLVPRQLCRGVTREHHGQKNHTQPGTTVGVSISGLFVGQASAGPGQPQDRVTVDGMASRCCCDCAAVRSLDAVSADTPA